MTTSKSAHLEFVSPYTPYSPDLASSYFHHFGPLRDELRGRRFADDDELKHGVLEELDTLAEFLRDRHTVSHAEVEKVC